MNTRNVFNIYANKIDIHIEPEIEINTTTPLLTHSVNGIVSTRSGNFLQKMFSINETQLTDSNETMPYWSRLTGYEKFSFRTNVLVLLFAILFLLICCYFVIVFQCCYNSVYYACCCGHASRCLGYSGNAESSSDLATHTNESLNSDRTERRRLLMSMPQPPESRRLTLKQAIIDKYKNKSNDREVVQRMWIQNK